MGFLGAFLLPMNTASTKGVKDPHCCAKIYHPGHCFYSLVCLPLKIKHTWSKTAEKRSHRKGSVGHCLCLAWVVYLVSRFFSTGSHLFGFLPSRKDSILWHVCIRSASSACSACGLPQHCAALSVLCLWRELQTVLLVAGCMSFLPCQMFACRIWISACALIGLQCQS